MQEIGIESSVLRLILNGQKTIEGRLGKPKFIKLRVGDKLSLREDVWKDGQIISSEPSGAVITITQLLYFETFEEMFSAVDYTAAIPGAKTKQEAVAAYRKYYSAADEEEYGVMAITFALDKPTAP